MLKNRCLEFKNSQIFPTKIAWDGVDYVLVPIITLTFDSILKVVLRSELFCKQNL